MKIRKGDKVKILAGKDKGKNGKIIQILPESKRVVVEGLNLLVKNVRPRRQGEKGQRIQFPAPLNVAKVGLICSKCGKITRVGYKFSVSIDGKTSKKIRICKKCQAAIDE